MDDSFSPEFWTDAGNVSALLGFPVDSVDVTAWSDSGGLTSKIFKVDLVPHGAPKRPLVLKLCQPKQDDSSMLGFPREALFLGSVDEVCPQLSGVDFLPQVLFADGDMATGAKRLLIERIEGVQAGRYFPSAPINWGVDLTQQTSLIPSFSEGEVVHRAVEAAAKLHAPYWGRTELLARGSGENIWRSADWIRGKSKEEWQRVLGRSASLWKQIRGEIEAGSGAAAKLKWDDSLVALIEKCYEATTWDSWLHMVQHQIPLTLVHGDFHPANMIIRNDREKSLALIDWDVVGLGSGPQDLGQFFISHSSPASRRQLASPAVEHYITALRTRARESNNADISTDFVWDEFVEGGFGRWAWMLPLLVSKCPTPMAQHFHDQLAAFAADYGILERGKSPLVRI